MDFNLFPGTKAVVLVSWKLPAMSFVVSIYDAIKFRATHKNFTHTVDTNCRDLFFLQGIVTGSLTMRRFSCSIKKRNISSATFVIRNFTPRRVYQFTACKCTKKQSTKYQILFQTEAILRLRFTGWKEFPHRTWRIMRKQRTAASQSQTTMNRRQRRINWNQQQHRLLCHHRWWCSRTWCIREWRSSRWWCLVSIFKAFCLDKLS